MLFSDLLVKIENFNKQKKIKAKKAVRAKTFIMKIGSSVKPYYQKLWPSGGVLGSRSEGRGFESRPMLHGSGVMPGQ